MGAAFIRCLWRAPADDRRPRWSQMRPLATIGGAIMVRTAALIASFVVASAVLARIGDAQLAANQIALSALPLHRAGARCDRDRGPGHRGTIAGRRRRRRRHRRRLADDPLVLVAGAAFGVVLLALTDALPRVFTNDQAVIDQAEQLWPLFALMQPSAAAVFGLDGILLGAGDARFLALSMLAAGATFVAIALASLGLDWGDRRRVGRVQRPDGRTTRDLRRTVPGSPLGAHRRGFRGRVRGHRVVRPPPSPSSAPCAPSSRSGRRRAPPAWAP